MYFFNLLEELAYVVQGECFEVAGSDKDLPVNLVTNQTLIGLHKNFLDLSTVELTLLTVARQKGFVVF